MLFVADSCVLLESFNSCQRILCLLGAVHFASHAWNSGKTASLTYLEGNTWFANFGGVNICVDPIFGDLTFGVPWLYTGSKVAISAKTDLNGVAVSCQRILVTQGFDDHAHLPTVTLLAEANPELQYICPGSAVDLLESCGVPRSAITVLKPGDKLSYAHNNFQMEIIATTGALLGPPWQQRENGYLIKPADDTSSGFPSVYIEPHCEYDTKELSHLQADIVITPVVAQSLMGIVNLVNGGDAAIKLAEILQAQYVVPMRNGELRQSGLLTKLLRINGSEESFVRRSTGRSIEVVSAPAGEVLRFEKTSDGRTVHVSEKRKDLNC